MTGTVILDDEGFPILLADVAPSGVAKIDPNTKSGNDAHDTRSGKFAPKAGKAPDLARATPNVDPLELARMRDALRDAARELELPNEDDIREFLAGRAKNPGQVDVPGFLRGVQEIIKDDVVDALDNQLRSAGKLRRGVRVAMPRGRLKRTLNGMTPEGIAEIMHRLEARGHDAKDLDRYFSSRVKANADEVKKAREGIAASEVWEADWLEFVDASEARDEAISPQEVMQFAARFASEVARNIPAPVINVEVPITMPTGKKKIVRDPKTGLVEAVEDE